MSTQNQNVIKLYQILQQLNDLEMTSLRQGGSYDGLIILNRRILADLIDDYQTALDELFKVPESQQAVSSEEDLPVKDSELEEYSVPLADSTEDVQPQIVGGGLGAAPAAPRSLNFADDNAANADSAVASQSAVADDQSVPGSDSSMPSAEQPVDDAADSTGNAADDNNDDNDDHENGGADSAVNSASSIDSSNALERDQAASDKIIDGSIAAPQADDNQSGANNGAPKLNFDEGAGDDSGDDKADPKIDDPNAPDDPAGNPDGGFNLPAGALSDNSAAGFSLTTGDDASDNHGEDTMNELFADNGYNG